MPTQDERDRAMAVHSLDDETRLHSGADETSAVMGAGGEVETPPPPAGPPMDPDTSEATAHQLDLAREQGEAYGRALSHMTHDVADAGGEKTAGDYIVGYAVEKAEGMYALDGSTLRWHDPGDTNAHLEIAVRDAADGRFVPCLEITVTMVAPDGTRLGPHRQPLLWHPMLYHYGRNWQLPADGEYRLEVHIEPPGFMRHDEVNGRRFVDPVDVEFTGVAVTRGRE
jgi:hypothetical protein